MLKQNITFLINSDRDSGLRSGAPVRYRKLKELPKEKHSQPMLSLNKTKDADAFGAWLKNKEGCISWKLDGLTVVLTYENGKLTKALTRGNGKVGEVITNNAIMFSNLPKSIPMKNKLIVRGEAIITYDDFKRINEKLPEKERYKNPRNLCSGTIRQLDNKFVHARNVKFFAFEALEGLNNRSFAQDLETLRLMGFEVVRHSVVPEYDISSNESIIEKFIMKETPENVKENVQIPIDGLVLTFNNNEDRKNAGTTARFPKHSIAFKWKDETVKTTLKEIEWKVSRTGLINPIAVFEPIELEGTIVNRASVHNVNIVKSLNLTPGDTISVYKANMIIPQIKNNLSKHDTNNVEIPKYCPVCGSETYLAKNNATETLYCSNKNCSMRQIEKFSRFVERDAMNIEGMSNATIEKFIEGGILTCYADFFKLRNWKYKIIGMEGFGEASYNNLANAAKKAKKTNLVRFLYALGIPHLGLENAKLIAKKSNYDYLQFTRLTYQDICSIKGIGDKVAQSIIETWGTHDAVQEINKVLPYLTFEKPSKENDNFTILDNKIFVITGDLELYPNRNELKREIERYGGKVVSTVSGKTCYLINNNPESQSAKNKKAQKLGVKIITEQAFAKMIK